MRPRAIQVMAFLVFGSVLSGCGGGGGGSSPTPQTAGPIAPGITAPAPTPSGAPVDDWTTYAHDYKRTGYQPQTLSVTKANVGSMKLRWQYAVGAEVIASPIVAGGLVYIEGLDGSINALDAQTGTLTWKQNLGGKGIAMTPTLADGKLFVGTHSQSGDVFSALDAATGNIVWTVTVGNSCIRGEPVVVNGRVIEGMSCGDPPSCSDGGVNAYDENTGTLIWSWKTTSVPTNGGGQWSPISYDGQKLYFGTGNVCKTKEATADAVVSMQLAGTLNWSFQPVNPFTDDDFGGGAMINNGQVFIADKNGFFYDLDAASGQQIWGTQLTTTDGYGPIGTATTDGAVLVMTMGYKSDPTKTVGPPGGGLAGLDPSGKILWQIRTLYGVAGYAAIANGIAFVNLDSSVTALDPETGTKLWSHAGPDVFYASPAIVPSGLYAADQGGNVYAFSLPASTASRSRRSAI
jgi:polyvinyl alcohol dehydrogenase (cytochrome)